MMGHPTYKESCSRFKIACIEEKIHVNRGSYSFLNPGLAADLYREELKKKNSTECNRSQHSTYSATTLVVTHALPNFACGDSVHGLIGLG
jgi:hypothetical protein